MTKLNRTQEQKHEEFAQKNHRSGIVAKIHINTDIEICI